MQKICSPEDVNHGHVSAIMVRALPWLLLFYCGASLLHFAHNAEFVADYPNLPAWISSSAIYATWFVILSIGVSGYVLFRSRHVFAGLLLLAVYTSLGLDGLLHYGRAPVSAHSMAMNATIWMEVAAAALALVAVLWIVVSRLLRRTVRDTRQFVSNWQDDG